MGNCHCVHGKLVCVDPSKGVTVHCSTTEKDVFVPFEDIIPACALTKNGDVVCGGMHMKVGELVWCNYLPFK